MDYQPFQSKQRGMNLDPDQEVRIGHHLLNLSKKCLSLIMIKNKMTTLIKNRPMLTALTYYWTATKLMARI